MELLNSTKCKCGKELKNESFDQNKPFKFDDSFYGGRIAMTGEKRCDCGRLLKGYFGMINGLELIDLEIIEEPTQMEKTEEKQKTKK